MLFATQTQKLTAFDEKSEDDEYEDVTLTIEKPGYVSYCSGRLDLTRISKAGAPKETETNVTLYPVPEAGKERDYRVVEGQLVSDMLEKYSLAVYIQPPFNAESESDYTYYGDVTLKEDGTFTCVLPFKDNTKNDWFDLSSTYTISWGDEDYLDHPFYEIKVLGETEATPQPYNYVTVNFTSDRYMPLSIHPDNWGFFA